MLKIIGIVGFVAVMGGCATSSIPDSQSRQVEAKHLLAFQDVPTGEYGVIQVKRDSGMMGSACRTGIYIDGKLSARLDASEIARFNVSVGDHLIGIGSVGAGAGLCIITLKEQTVIVKDKATQRYRVFLDLNGLYLTPTSQ
ncbi:MAG: hypothetical protein NVSMB70_10180 [Chamaesiphon sp.]